MLAEFLSAVFLAAAPTVPQPQPPAPVSAVSTASVPLRAGQAAALRAALGQAESHGLPAAAFLPPDLDSLLEAKGDPAVRARGEAVLIEAAGGYAQALHNGRLRPDQFTAEWSRRPARYDATAELRQAIAQDRVQAWLASLPPPSSRYAELQSVLARYQALAAAGGWQVVPAGPTLRAGADDPRVPALRRRLAVEVAGVAPGGGTVFDAGLVQALTAFQASHGLDPDGVLGPATLAELNVPVEARLAQIRANMERRRWTSRTEAPRRIEVNIADQSLVLFEDGRPSLTMRTVVGRPANRTPMFDDVVERVVFNPPWNVPRSIATKEILPKLAKDPGYLARNNFVVQPGAGSVSVRLQQRPGPESALGLYKFDLPNAFDVYLHDTPAKTLFARAQRAFSHGCVRVEKPAELARTLLASHPNWPESAIQAALDSGKTTFAPLQAPVPVSFGYWTVFVDASGAPQFRRDLYGWDAQLLDRIEPR